MKQKKNKRKKEETAPHLADGSLLQLTAVFMFPVHAGIVWHRDY